MYTGESKRNYVSVEERSSGGKVIAGGVGHVFRKRSSVASWAGHHPSHSNSVNPISKL